MPQAVLFDMDGTLIDSEHSWLSAERDLAATTGSTWTEQDGMGLIGMSLYDSARILRQRFKLTLSLDEIIEQLTDNVVGKLAEGVPWRPGALELLQLLREANVKTALVTMSMRRMALAVAGSAPFDAFDVVIAGDDVSKGKPDPEAYLAAASALQVDITQCIAFEDSISGLHSAEASGAVAIGVPNLVTLPAKEGRIIWPTLRSVSLDDLRQVLAESRNS